MLAEKLKPHKKAYIINCSSQFRDDVQHLAQSKRVNVGDLARSAILALPEEMIAAFPDPGEPDPNDREKIMLKSGEHSGKIWRRKPRLQARLPEGYQPKMLRKALALALALDSQQKRMFLQDSFETPLTAQIERLNDDRQKLRNIIKSIAFIPTARCATIAEALYILGLPHHPHPSDAQIKKRYRELASIFHPDGICGDHERMSQLNLAFSFLRIQR